MKDESEQSNPSRGSLEEGPVAWMQPNQRDLYVSDERDQWHTVPLYRSPTLTEAEREAIERGYCSLMGVEDMSADCSRWDAEAADTLRGLLERTK